jgi:hypothetical protein
MLLLVVAMLVILVLAGLVVVYVAFPHRGEDVPHVPWLGRLLRRGVASAPTLHNTADPGDPVDPHEGHEGISLAFDHTDLDHGRHEGRRRA